MENKLFKRKSDVVITISIITILISLIGFTYSYFSARITENNKTQTIIKSNVLGLVYTGVTDINVQDIIPGDYMTKTFTVENTSNREVDYNIYMENITNEFNEELVYTVSDQNGVVIEEGPLPETKSGKTYIKTGLKIDTGVIKNFTLTIKFKYSESDQNTLQGKVFNGTLGIDTEKVSETTVALEKCIRAKTLHTEICNETSNSLYCSADDYTMGSTITYGNLGSGPTLATGDALTCDVNGDGEYNEETERFYYVTDMNDDTAVLIYYNNVTAGSPDNMSSFAYKIDNSDFLGPQVAKLQLPTTEQWSNVSLSNPIRDITDERGQTRVIGFSYEGYAARLLTYQEVYNVCYDGIFQITSSKALSGKCQFIMENSRYSSSNKKTYGTWLETSYSSGSSYAWYIRGDNRLLDSYYVRDASVIGVRPVIEVSKSDIKLD